MPENDGEKTHTLFGKTKKPPKGGNFREILKLPAWAVFIDHVIREHTISRNYLRKCLLSGIFGLGGKKKITQPLYQKLSEDVVR
ncbi:MAG: hypothetical protein ACI4O4_03745 [Candidatus Ventricola sp.]